VKPRAQLSEYILIGSPMELNLSGACRSKVAKLIDEATPDMSGKAVFSSFDSAKAEVLLALEHGFWNEFKRYAATSPKRLSVIDMAKKRIVIVGGGFCGVFAAGILDADPRFHVTLIDTKEFFEYTPGVVRKFSSARRADCLSVPHSTIVRNGRCVVGEVRAVRSDCVAVNFETVMFDYLVLATGSHYPSRIKTTSVTEDFRAKQLLTLAGRVEQAKNITLVGGGVVGVEIASEIAHEHRGTDKTVRLVHAHDRLLHRIATDGPEHDAHAMALEALKALGVEVTLDERVVTWDQQRQEVVTAKGLRLPSDVVFWCGGPVPLTGYMRAHMSHHLSAKGLIKVGPDMRLKGCSNIFAGGDIVTCRQRPEVLSAALQISESAQRATSTLPSDTGVTVALGAEVDTVALGAEVDAEDGYLTEERLARIAVDHGLSIAVNIQLHASGLPCIERQPERGIQIMLVSLGPTDGILVEGGIPSFGEFASKKLWHEAETLEELRSGTLTVHQLPSQDLRDG
jgi:NADH dehydrogenase FAD-containing subunit